MLVIVASSTNLVHICTLTITLTEEICVLFSFSLFFFLFFFRSICLSHFVPAFLIGHAWDDLHRRNPDLQERLLKSLREILEERTKESLRELHDYIQQNQA